MNLTPDEARERWCPFARSYDANADEQGAVTVNRSAQGKPDRWCLCLADGCMAWRWWSSTQEHGYCGLAGRPAVPPS